MCCAYWQRIMYIFVKQVICKQNLKKKKKYNTMMYLNIYDSLNIRIYSTEERRKGYYMI